VTPERRVARPQQRGRAYCGGCGKQDATTRWERGMEFYEPHYFGSNGKKCARSDEPVIPPVVRR